LCWVLVLAAGSAWAAPLDDARKLLSQGRAADAQKVVSDVLKAHPGDRDARFLLANILAAQGQLEAAYAIFDALVQESPDDPIGATIKRLFEERGANAKDAARLGALLGRAQQAVQAKRWEDAIGALTEAVGLVPGNVAVRANLAQVLGEVRRYADAVPHMEEAVRRRPGDIALVRRLAILYERADRPQDAARVYRQILKAAPNDRDALFALGRVALFTDKDDAAAAGYFQRILQADPNSTDALFLLGLAQVGMARTDAAVRTFEKTLAVDPKYFRAAFELGKLYDAAGRDADALKAFQDTVRYGGNSPEAEQSRRRLALFGTSPEIARQVRRLLDQGVQELDAGRLEDAERDLKGVLALVPGNVLALYNLATVYTRQGKTEPAIDALKQAVASDPTHFPSHYGLGLIYEGAGRFEEAYDAYKQVVRYAPPDDPLYAQAKEKVDRVEALLAEAVAKKDAHDAFLAGNKLVGEGKLEEALAQYEKAIQLDDQNPYYYYNAGILDLELKHLAEGFEAFKKAVALKPDYMQAHFRLAGYYYLTGFSQLAVKEFREVLRYGTNEPEVAQARKLLGDALKEADRKEKATAYFQVANALDARKDPERGLFAIREALKRTPEHRGMQVREIELLMELDKAEEARDRILEAIKARPDDPQLQYYLGKVEGALGHMDDALVALRKAAKASPDNVEVQMTLAAALEQAGLGDEAVATLRAVLAKNPDQVNVVLELGRMLRRLDRPTEAAALYDWYLSGHDETTDLLVERGLLAVLLGSAPPRPEIQAESALAGIVTSQTAAAGQPKYATPTEWFERAIAVAGPNDQRMVDFARQQIEQSRRLRMSLAQTVVDYNTNANNSATNPQSGVSSRITFDAQYVIFRNQFLALPLGVTTDHHLFYSFQTYVNQNRFNAQALVRVPHLQLTPDVTLARTRTQRGKTSDSYAAGAVARLDVPFPRNVTAQYRRTEFTSFTNPTNNYLEELTLGQVGHTMPVGSGVQLNGQVRYTHRVRDAIAATLDTDRTEVQVSLGARRSFAGQRTVGLNAFASDATEIRTANVLPTNPSEILPIDSHNVGGSLSLGFPIYPHVNAAFTGTYSVTNFLRGLISSFRDPDTGQQVFVETAQQQSSLSYSLRFFYRPDPKTTWTFSLARVEARSSVDVPVDVQDILTDQVQLSNINGRDEAIVTMNYAF